MKEDIAEIIQEYALSHFKRFSELSTMQTTISAKEKKIKLHDLSAVISMGSSKINIIIVFSADKTFVDKLTQLETNGIELDKDEYYEMLHATLAETANIILGHTTRDVGLNKSPISLSPPMLIESSNSMTCAKKASLKSIIFISQYGNIEIHIVKPTGNHNPILEECIS